MTTNPEAPLAATPPTSATTSRFDERDVIHEIPSGARSIAFTRTRLETGATAVHMWIRYGRGTRVIGGIILTHGPARRATAALIDMLKNVFAEPWTEKRDDRPSRRRGEPPASWTAMQRGRTYP